MSWRVADSLTVLKEQVNARWPDRSKASDGFIGDTAHAQTNSDHNPNAQGVVCAFDITHDPANGPDIADLFTEFCANPHPDQKYVIANGQIASFNFGWEARPYRGDPHTNHIHVSVGVGSDGHSAPGTYDDTTPWSLPGAPAPAPPPAPLPDLSTEIDMLIIQHAGTDYLCDGTRLIALGDLADAKMPRLAVPDDATWERLIVAYGKPIA